MATQLRLQSHQISDLQVIRDLDVSRIEQLAEHLKGLNPLPFRPAVLREQIATVFKDQDKAIDPLLRQMLGVYGLIGQMSLTVDQAFAALRFGIETGTNWTPEQLTEWSKKEPKLRELCTLGAVRLVAKALELSYQYSNLLRQSRIITDVRPVFNDDATGLDGAVISHSLHLRYDSADGDHVLTLALDERDIKLLREQCDRAIKKAETASDKLSPSLQTLIAGRDQS